MPAGDGTTVVFIVLLFVFFTFATATIAYRSVDGRLPPIVIAAARIEGRFNIRPRKAYARWVYGLLALASQLIVLVTTRATTDAPLGQSTLTAKIAWTELALAAAWVVFVGVVWWRARSIKP